MKALLCSQDDLVCHRLEIRMAATADTKFDGWIGAVLRNNLLNACQQVYMPSGDISFREFLSKIPLKAEHPLYKELENGFPAPYIITPTSHSDFASSRYHATKGEILSFTLTLIGNISECCIYFLNSLRKMCQRGFGNPMHAFLLIDVFECGLGKEKKLLLAGENIIDSELEYPISLSTYFSKHSDFQSSIFKIHFETPVSLFKASKKEKVEAAFQDKLNGFPSFYQFSRSLVHRLVKLIILYSVPYDNEKALSMLTCIDEYIESASISFLREANIRYIKINSAPQKEKENRIQLAGYVGDLQFEGDVSKFYPLLLFMQYLGVGENISYGMGCYSLKVENNKPKKLIKINPNNSKI